MDEPAGVQLRALEEGVAALRRSVARPAGDEPPPFATAEPPPEPPPEPLPPPLAVAAPNGPAPGVTDVAGASPGSDTGRPGNGRRLSRRRLLLGGGAAAAGATGALAATAGPSPAGAQVTSADASGVAFTPTGSIEATDVQAALAEVDAEKAPLASPRFTGTSVARAGHTQLRPWVDVRAFGATGDGSTDDTDALVLAIFVAAVHKGGTVLLPPGRYAFSGELVIPDGVDLWGCGGHQQIGNASGTVLQAADATARLVFRGVGGQSGNFGLDGRHVAAPDRGLLFIDAVERIFTALRVSRSATDGVVVERTQNCTFNQFLVADCVRDGLVLDDGAGNNAFIRCELSACGRDNVRIRATDNPDVPFRGRPTGNYFMHCLVERGRWQDGGWNGPNNSMVNITGGHLNRFSQCAFAMMRPNTSTSGWLVVMSGGTAAFESCEFASDFAGGLWNLGAGVELHGVNHMNCAGTAVRWDDAETRAWGRVLGRLDFGGKVTTRWAGTGGHQRLAFETDRPHLLWLESDAAFALRTELYEEAGFRFQVTSGGEIQVNDGTGYAAMATWRLQPGGRGWETPDDVHLNGGSLALQQVAGPPPAPPAGDRATMYVRNDRLVVAFDDGGTVRYKSLLLSGPGAVWTDSTTPP
jgi:hypothetical protein